MEERAGARAPVEGRDRRASLRFLITVAVAVVAVGWAFLLRPELLGGSTSYIIVNGSSMEPALRSGDLVIVRRAERYRPGDVVAYRVPVEPFRGAQVLHRIVGGSAREGFVVRGDNRDGDDLWRPRPGDIAGRAWLRLPAAGRLLLGLRSPLLLGIVVGTTVFIVTLTWNGRCRRKRPPGDDPGTAHR